MMATVVLGNLGIICLCNLIWRNLGRFETDSFGLLLIV